MYTRITLTRFTTVYFFLAVANCVVLVTLQGVTLGNNSQAVDLSEALLNQINGTHDSKLPVFIGQELQMCDGIPGQPGAQCYSVAKYKKRNNRRSLSKASRIKTRRLKSRIVIRDEDSDDSDSDDSDDEDEGGVLVGDTDHQGTPVPVPTPRPSETTTVGVPTSTPASATLPVGSATPVPQSTSTATTSSSSPVSASPRPSSTSVPATSPSASSNGQSQPGQAQSANSQSGGICSATFVWFHDVAEDEKREDIASIFFHFWTLSMAMVTILNESLPHLAATLVAHILGTAWAGFRIHSAENLKQRFYGLLALEPCIPEASFDAWWEARRVHATIIAVCSILSLLGTLYLSVMLYKVYASQTFSRVGASPQVHRIYKTVLLLSASLQLAWFFTLTSSGIWIDKISHGTLMHLAHHCKLYLAAFAVVLILSFPWIVLGWTAVRKEHRKLFIVFGAISVILVGISSAMFSSGLYRYIFKTWPFFATVTVTAYIFTVATLVLGVLCRLNFGKGLAHYLQVTETLEGMDFTPVYFSNDTEKAGSQFPVRFDGSQDEKYSSESFLNTLQHPELSYQPTTAKVRGPSIYTNSSGAPLKLSSTPSLFREGGLRKSVASTIASRRWFDGPALDTDAMDAYSQLPMPPKTASPDSMSGRPRSRELTPGSGENTPSYPSASPFAPISNQESLSDADSPRSLTPVRKGLPSNPKTQDWV